MDAAYNPSLDEVHLKIPDGEQLLNAAVVVRHNEKFEVTLHRKEC